MLLPPALGSSPHPPVSVYGTGPRSAIVAFLDGWLLCFPTFLRSASRLCFIIWFFLYDSSSACTGLLSPGSHLPSVSPQFCLHEVQESLPVPHRLRVPASP